MRIVTLAMAFVVTIPGVVSAQETSPDVLKRAAQQGLALLESTSPAFIQKGGCNSCHNQKLAAAAQAFVRARGIATGPPIAQLNDELSDATTERFIEYAQGGGAGVSGLAYELFARASSKQPADERVHAQLYYLRSMQRADGSWRAGGNRPPLTFDDFTTTTLILNALLTYGRSVQTEDTRERIERARTWLLQTKPHTTQERAFRLIGLVWSKADRAAIRDGLSELVSHQREDGGWSQLASMPADAYATGMALYAIYQTGMSTKDRAYQAGLRFLLKTQAADGTWRVKSRALPIQPYFETGYPYDHDQWISAAGAAYATMAIAAAVDPPRVAAR